MRAACAVLLLCAVSAAASALALSPASAQGGGGLRLEVPGTYYATSENPGPGRADLTVVLDAGQTPASRAEVDIDASDVLHKIRLRPKGPCRESRPYVFHCRGRGPEATEPRMRLLVLEVVGDDKAAEPGASGVVRYTATAPGGRRATGETRMIAGVPHLWLPKLTAGSARAGAPIEIPVSVLNKGPITSDSLVLEMLAGEGGHLTFAKRYRNCRYASEGNRMFCVIDTRLEPGRAVTLAEPVVLGGSAAETRAGVYVSVYPPGQEAGHSFNADEFPLRGTAPALTVEPVKSTEGFTEKFITFAWLDTDQKVDLRAVGGDITGRPGDITQLALGVHNAGPGRITSRYFRFTVDPPEGTILLPPPKPSYDPEGDNAEEWDCGPWQPGARHYSCSVHSLSPGESTTVLLRFRIDRRDAGHGGVVRAVAEKAYAGRDPRKANDSAPITVNGKGGSPGGFSGALVSAAGAAGVVVAAAAVPIVLRRRRRAEER